MGFLQQEEYDGNPWEVHRSRWAVKEMRKLGFKVRGFCGLWFTKGERDRDKFSGIIGWIVARLNEILSPLIYLVPNIAHHMICIKVKDSNFGS